MANIRISDELMQKCIKKLEVGKIYKNRLEVVRDMGLPDLKNKGRSGLTIDKYLSKYTKQIDIDGRKYLFVDILVDEISNNGNSGFELELTTLKGLMNLGILKLISEKYKDVEKNGGNHIVLIPKNRLLFDLKTFNDLFGKYQYNPTKFLGDNIDFELNNVNTIYEFMPLVRSKLTKNLKDSLNELSRYEIIDYIYERPFINYRIDRRVLKDEYAKIGSSGLGIFNKEQLENITKNIKTDSYNNVLMDGALKGVDVKDKFQSITSDYNTIEKRVLNEYSEIFGFGNIIDELKSPNEIKKYRFKIFSKIESSNEYKISNYYKKINKLLSNYLTKEVKKYDKFITDIYVTNINYQTQISYNKDVVEKVFGNNKTIEKFNMKDINDLIINQIKDRAKERHIEVRDKFKKYNECDLDNILEKFTDKVRINDKYTKDYNKLTDKLIKIK